MVKEMENSDINFKVKINKVFLSIHVHNTLIDMLGTTVAIYISYPAWLFRRKLFTYVTVIARPCNTSYYVGHTLSRSRHILVIHVLTHPLPPPR